MKSLDYSPHNTSLCDGEHEQRGSSSCQAWRTHLNTHWLSNFTSFDQQKCAQKGHNKVILWLHIKTKWAAHLDSLWGNLMLKLSGQAAC